MSRDLHPTVRRYVNSSSLAESYDRYFDGLPLFSYDCRFVARHLELPRDPAGGFSVLDLGCGTGRHLLLCAENGCLATGVDLNPHMLAKAEKKFAAAGIAYTTSGAPAERDRVRLLHGDFLHPPFSRDERFDAILMMFSTLGLVDGSARRREFLHGLRASLKPDGMLILHAHNELRHRRPGLFGRIDDMRHRARRLEPGDHIQENYRGVLDLYVHYFTPGELRELIVGTGYHIKEFLFLNENRDGPLDPALDPEYANGFLVAARRA